MEAGTDVVGREQELGELTERLATRRLVTLTGPGGIGKTALARAAAARVGPRFDYGAVMVDLTRVDQPEGVAEAVAGQLGCADFDSLLNSPSEQPALIVFDNCEHVLDAAADVASKLLDACKMPTIIATSRSPLDVPGESVISLGPLETPADDDIDTPAVDLLRQRALDTGGVVGPDDRAQLAEIARRLDGVPLALELAAARLRSHTVAEVLAELDARPHALARPRFRGKPSHRSVADMVGWSYELLSAEVQRTFDHLGVFAGPFTLDLAGSVADAGDSIDAHIEELVGASLVVADRHGATAWYRLLHPIRAVARNQLEQRGERVEAERRLVDQVVAVALDVISSTTAGWDGSVLTDLLGLYDNTVAAIRWALDHDDTPDRAFVLVAVSWGIIHQAHTAELAELAERALRRWPDPAHPGWADAAATAATCRNLLGDVDGAIDLATDALDHVGGSPHAPASLRRVLAQANRAAGRYPASRDWFAEGAEVARELGNLGMAMELEVDLGLLHAELGDHATGRRIVDAARDEALERGMRINAAWGRAGQAALALRDDPATALGPIDDAIAESTAIDYPAGLSFSLRARAVAQLAVGDTGGAASTLLELLYELLQRGGLNDLRIVLDPTAALFRTVGAPAWRDLAVTAAALPVTSVAVPVDQELFADAAPDGRLLPTRDAYVACRDGLQQIIAGGPEPGPVPPPTPAGPSLTRLGDVWELSFAGQRVNLKHAKGIDDLATLLAAPGREFAALELAGSTVASGGAADAVIDEQARREYEQRVRDLQAEVDEADAANDLARADRARDELDTLVDHLTKALGVGGRTRRSTDDAERARSAVTQRLRSTIKRIGEHHPALADHLSSAVSTGMFCVYAPTDSTVWVVAR